MNQPIVLTIEELRERVEAVLAKSGFNRPQTVAFAHAIVSAERDGCKSHGIYRLEGALQTVRAGKITPDAMPTVLSNDGPTAIVTVDAAGGFANAGFEAGKSVLVDRARQHGLAALVINDCAHLSALWLEVEALAAEGIAAIAMCPSYATVAPAGGNKPLLGTNPFAFGWPRINANPYIFDFATSVAARGEIELHRRSGKPLPEGWALNTAGEPTTDPEAALAGAMLPFGGAKGSALSTMIELLAGIMIGDRTSPEVLDYLGTSKLSPMHGELIIAFDPQAFVRTGAGNPLARAEMLFESIVGQGARLPSQRRYQARILSENKGIKLSAEEVRQLDRFASYGVDALGPL